MPRHTGRRGGGEMVPQIGGPGTRYAVIAKKTGEPKVLKSGSIETAIRFPNPDLGEAVTRAAAMQNFAHSLTTAHPEALKSGPNWYPKVHEAVSKGIGTGRGSRGFMRGASDRTLSGAAIVAAVSPNMDWDTANIHAFDELKGLRSEHWAAIMTGTKGAYKDAVKGLSISRAARGNLRKAGRLIQGEDPHTVIPERTAPKTHAFMHNIADPDNPHHVTIDGRAWDTLTNRMRPWEFNRGLGGMPAGRGTSTRYEQAESIVQAVAPSFGLSPSAAQATSWEHVKYHVEQGGLTSKGAARKQGPSRVGQPYFDPHTGAPAAHMSRQFSDLL